MKNPTLRALSDATAGIGGRTTVASARRPAALIVAFAVLLFGYSLVLVTSARANLQFDQVGVQLTDTPKQSVDANGNPVFRSDPDNIDPSTFQHKQIPVYDELGSFTRQAGGHPDFTLSFSLPTDPNAVVDGQQSPGPPEAVHSVEVDLPPGMLGNPNAVTECDMRDFAEPSVGQARCPLSSQVGVADVGLAGGSGDVSHNLVGIFNLKHGPDVPARFGINYLGAVAIIDGHVRPGDYGISAASVSISQALTIQTVKFTLWGVPADPSHDSYRGGLPDPLTGPSQSLGGVTPVPFMYAPTSCTGSPVSFTVRGDSWEHRGVFDTRTITMDTDGTPLVFDGCDALPFAPSIDVKALSRVADAPTALSVDLKVPQSDDPSNPGTAHVRKVVMRLPQGMTVSPSSAAGLGACSPAQIGLGTNDAPSCPDSSKLGKVTITTPVLPDPLTGDIILAAQNDNPFRSLIAMYLAVKGPGFYVKLPGRVDLDQTTGQLTVTFDNTPQVPFSEMKVDLLGGSQAALATPTACGTYNTHVEITSWASDDPVSLDSPTRIDQNCDAKAFTPSFTAGMTNKQAGQFSPFTFTLTRQDGMPTLSTIDMALPPGLLADIGSVPRCDAAAANAGTCPVESKIGTTSALSGPGAQPLGLTGNVYLTGPYKDAPFGLSIAVPTAGQAGPFDLGTVVVRAGIYVDRRDAHATVKSDPLPTIIQGIPLRLRQVGVTIDRPKFMLNPTSCNQKTIFANFGAVGGVISSQTQAFQVGGCGDLDLKPKLAVKLTGTKSTKDGTSPGVEATLTDPGGGSNYAKVEAKLPLALALEPSNAQSLCKPEQAAAFNCPKTSIVGSATARSVLPHELSGPVYFVEGRRKTSTGRTKASLPDLWIPLSADGVTIDVRASSQVDSSDRLVTTFHDLPDAPIKNFDLKISGGKHGILVVSGKSTCDRDMTFDLRYTGQNDETKVATAKPKVAGCKPSVKSTKTTKKSVTVKVGNLAAGKLTMSGGGLLSRASKTLKAGPEATLTAKLTNKARATLSRTGKVTVRVSVAYKPKVGKTVKLTKRVTVKG
ncbi:MAG TPA: hypothetical protein VFG42_03910 [Baekduia sp.]|uniref:hypothetical protein n=1 Tax=Baekduia sp. TaxID=2600305 RepID=UPI002D77186E|nr:hypothetical protein [Baekduia sp.]HET6505909.1 hypothetical protein [Baekduia sp.]